MTIKINSEKYIQLFQDWPDMQFINFGWEWEVKYYLYIPVVIYTKKLYK